MSAPVVFLNGASSAGKTSIGKALQDILAEPFLLLGLDTCFSTVPDRWAGGPMGPLRHHGFAYVDLPAEGEHPMLAIAYGDVGWRIMAGFHRGVAEIVRAGNPVIIDEMLLDERVGDDWREVLAPLRPLWVGVHCATDELARRERQRSSRLGLARWSASHAHAGMHYDITVDTTSATAADCATAIASRLAGAR